MPQLNPSFFLSELFWLFISFAILYMFVHNFIAPKMFMIFEEREAKISGTLRKAEKIRNEAKKFESEYNAKLNHAFKTASLKISKATEEFKIENNSKKANRDKETQLLLKESEKRINEFKKRSEKELLDFSVEMVEGIIDNIVGIKLADNDKIKHMILSEKREVSLR